jgi:hypothetical protein
MITITLTPFLHRGKEQIGIYFPNDPSINRIIRNELHAKWSGSNKCWYIPLENAAYHHLKTVLRDKATIDNRQLRDYLVNRKQDKPPATIPSNPVKKHLPASFKKATPAGSVENIHSVNAHILPAMEQQLKLKAYSASTIRTYLNEIRPLLLLLRNKPADTLTTEELKRYLQYCFEKLKLSENTLH